MSMPPPSTERPPLPLMVLPEMVAVPLAFATPPPAPVSEIVFPETVESVRVRAPRLEMPPPLSPTELPVMVLDATSAVALLALKMPPPLVNGVFAVVFLLTILLDRVSEPELRMPPPLPLPALPCRIVTSWMSTLPSPVIKKTREVATADEVAAWMMVSPEPAPVRVRSPVRVSWVPRVRV